LVQTVGQLDRGSFGEIPASHRDLVECPPVAALTTVGPDGYPQTTVVWCDFDGECVRITTIRGFAKERNMRRNPRVTLLCYDPSQPMRYLEIRGMVVGMTETGAVEHLDQLASRYAGRTTHYYGGAIPESFAKTETPILCRIQPIHITAVDQADTEHRP
jgi:PPOX class probable F420-dependent enzyme